MSKDFNYKISFQLIDVAYILYVISWFMEDVATISADNLMISVLRYISYIMLLIYLFDGQYEKSKIFRFILILFLSIVISALTGGIYWAVIVLFIYAANELDIIHFLRLNFMIITFMTLIVIGLMLIGILPNLVTPRFGETIPRYAMGFYHSDVLPIIIMYLFSYRLLIREYWISKRELCFWVVLGFAVNRITMSRNGWYGMILMTFFFVLFRFVKSESFLKDLIVKMVKYVGLFCVVFSIGLMIYQATGSAMARDVNSFFTGRFGVAYSLIKYYGIHLINRHGLQDIEIGTTYTAIDNGYLFVLLRHGILFLLFYIILFWRITIKYNDHLTVMAVIIVIAVTNMMDNDLYSYGFLPYILMAYSNMSYYQENVMGEQIFE